MDQKFNRLKKIAILNYNLSNNSLGRAYILGQLLSGNFQVEIMGPLIKGGIWEPLRNSEIPIKVFPYSKFPSLLFKLPKILKSIDAEIIYAIKPRFTSFGLGLLKKFFAKTPLILDIDDWEVSFYLQKGFTSRLSRLIHIFNPNGFFWTWFLQFLIPCATKITTVSTYLQRKFGGEVIIHAKDTDFLSPGKFEGSALKKQFGLEGKKIVTFLGTPRRYKGVEDVLKAILSIEDSELLMMVIGADMSGVYEKDLKKLGGAKLLLVPPIAYQEVPKYLALSDIVVIPQRKTFDTMGQIPSKLFDAMSMAKPIIATKVSDIPDILHNCGILVDAQSPDQFRKAILWVFENQDKAAEMGQKARQKSIKEFSFTSIRQKLLNVMGEFI
jgi:glycosyltransferase involved in cell wall biosynthesis